MSKPNPQHSHAHDTKTLTLARCIVRFCAGTGDADHAADLVEQINAARALVQPTFPGVNLDLYWAAGILDDAGAISRAPNTDNDEPVVELKTHCGGRC